MPITVFLQTFKCQPVSVFYSLISIGSLSDPHQLKCLSGIDAISLSTRILHILTDVSLLCVPIIIMIRVQIPMRKKARIIAIFALGGMSTLASILRNVDIFRYNDDITWQYYEVYAWNIVDICFAVIVASLPALNHLLDIWLDQLKGLTSHPGPRPSTEDLSTPPRQYSIFNRQARTLAWSCKNFPPKTKVLVHLSTLISIRGGR
ncbi:hypothetical protein GGR54DRAFT_483420 [Hypoxylon sp. NC1633]|nr:hypothetical protein GGR54DRAFT_483420 [Hypoxylon sp. NC1633]